MRKEARGNRVIIPSAIYIQERLQGIGKIPAVIYPINGEITFDFFYRQYEGTAESFEIICYEGAEKVHRRLTSNRYLTKKIHIIDLPVLEDLGHTVYAALSGETVRKLTTQ